MRSMTGFGRGAEHKDGNGVSIEISGINRKHSDIRFTAPKEIAALEARLRPTVQEYVSRGCVTVQIEHELSPEHRSEQVQFDTAIAKKVVSELRQIIDDTGIASDVTLSDVLTVPGVVREQPDRVPIEQLHTLASGALAQALKQFNHQREEEGSRLATDVRARCNSIADKVKEVSQYQDEVLQQQRDKLRQRLEDIGGGAIGADEERLEREAVYYAERSDISEELTRLDSHLSEVRKILDSPEAGSCGRELDFFCQEMHRELNTLGAKTADSACASLALQAKAELARMREQVQNIE